MDQLAFTLVLASALMHALWNLLVKRSQHKTVFIWWMFLAASLLFTVTIPFISVPFALPGYNTALMLMVAAISFVLYHLFNGRAYRGGDLSMVYPLCQTSMIYVPVWGVLLLGEVLSLTGILGILLVIFGTYSVQLQSISLAELLRPFYNLKNSSVRDALTAGFIYSIGSIAEKTGVSDYSPLHFTYFLVLLMLAMMSINIARSKYRVMIMSELRQNWGLILISGPVMMSSFLTFRYALNISQVSYVVPVRQISIVLGVLIGIVFLGESFGRIRMISAALIMAGVVMIRFG